MEVQQKMPSNYAEGSVWITGSQGQRGGVLWFGAGCAYGCKDAVKEWSSDQDRWVVEAAGKGTLAKAGSTFATDGHVVKWAVFEQEAMWGGQRLSDGLDD